MFLTHRKAKALYGSRLFLISAFVIITHSLYSQFVFNERCQEAYQLILNFQFEDATKLLDQEISQSPDNLIPVYLANYIDFFKLFTGEDKVLFEQLKSNRSLRIDKLERGSKVSPYYRFCLAGVTLQWAFVRLKFGEYTTAAFEIRRAFLLIKENQKKFPDFIPNQIGLGVLHIMVGLVPDQYRWLADLAGLEGNVTEGISELRNVLNYNGANPVYSLFKPEACFYLAFIDVNLMNSINESLSLIRQFDRDTSLFRYNQSPLIIYAKSSILMKNGRNNEAIALLDNFKPFPGTHPFVFLNYIHGLAKLNNLDTSSVSYLSRFVNEFTGLNYIKSAYQKMAWAYLLSGDSIRYLREIELAGMKGNAIVDEDKQAYSEFNVGIAPAIPLLKSRLLFDGGYYEKALKVLLNTPLDTYIRSRKDLTEYTYRLGRIYHAKGNIPKAVQYYTSTVEGGRGLPHYFAANAALNLGWIYESKGNFFAADTNYQLCASMRYDEYENSLRQKAKAGLNRLKKLQD